MIIKYKAKIKYVKGIGFNKELLDNIENDYFDVENTIKVRENSKKELNKIVKNDIIENYGSDMDIAFMYGYGEGYTLSIKKITIKEVK